MSDDAHPAGEDAGPPSPSPSQEKEGDDGGGDHNPMHAASADPPPQCDLPPLLRARLAKRGILPAHAAAHPGIAVDGAGPPATRHPPSSSGPRAPPTPPLVWRPVPPAAAAHVAHGPPLPPGWGAAFDWGYGRPYFFNALTGVRAWVHPLLVHGMAAPPRDHHHHRHGRGRAPPPPLLPAGGGFEPAATFGGPRPGKAFKMGVRGLGYYDDDGGGGGGLLVGGGGGGGSGGPPPAAPPPPPRQQLGAGATPPPGARPAAVGAGGGGGGGGGGGRGGGGPPRHPPPLPPPAASLDPMDPSAYSDAPRGKWSSGLEAARK